MAEPHSSKRVIVDGIEFGQLALFPRILGAALSALQPARLIIALFMVVLLIAIGRVWDRMTEARVHPMGLAVGSYSAQEDGSQHQAELRNAMAMFTPGFAGVNQDSPFQTNEVLRRIKTGYGDQLDAARNDAERAQLTSAYQSTLREIERTRPKGTFEATVAHVAESFGEIVGGVLTLEKDRTLQGLYSLLIATPVALWNGHPWFLGIFGAFTLLVLAVGGGGLSRMAACQASSGERLSMRQAIDFSLSRWGKLLWALLLPMVIAAIIAAVVWLMGVLMAAPVLDVVGGVVYGFALVLGFFIAFLLVGYVLGFPMLVPAVAAENCDGADAMQRAYAYTVTKPLHLLGYWLIGLIGAGLGYLLVGIFATLMLNVTASLYQALSDNAAIETAGGYRLFELTPAAAEPVGGPWNVQWASGAIAFWEALVLCIVAAYVLSYFFSASTIGYLLMRRVVDGQDPEEIWRPGLVPGTLAPIPERRPTTERESQPT